MISFQQNFGTPTVTVTPEHWEAILTSDEIRRKIARIRALRKEGNQKEADRLKRSLPAVCYQATFRESTSKAGNRGQWRKQGEAVLNGLFMLDIDHIEGDPRALVNGWMERWKAEHADIFKDCTTHGEEIRAWCDALGILLVSVTSSGEGLRLVCKADVPTGNLADNQHRLARELDVICDEACKDASRLSFVPTWDDIIYSDYKTLLTYNNEEFEEKYGELYRQGRSAGTKRPERVCDNHVAAVEPVPVGDEARSEERPEETQALQQTYGGVAYGDIISKWLDTNATGWNSTDDETRRAALEGNRHRLLLRLACDLRYICDKRQLHKRLVQQSPLGAMLREEGAEKEVDDIADSSHGYRLWRTIPQAFAKVLEAAGVRQPRGGAAATDSKAGIDYEAWWSRLQPLLDQSPLLREACEDMPPHHRIGGVLASGAMFGTYLTRCWWQHYDGKPYRLSFLVYVIGAAASGKSAIGDIDRLIMAPMVAADRAGREWERQYKEEAKKRALSSKSAKSDAPEQQHPVIRYVPSTISNAMLYRRLDDATDPEATDWNGDPMHLHLYTFEAELATALRVQQGSWAGKLDLECKSFQNEYAGVDYANADSHNGIIAVNWNQVITGTPDAMRRKIRKSTVLDGLVTRLCLFPMPASDYTMLQRSRNVVRHERDCMLRATGLQLEKVSGELECQRLVDFAYDYEQDLCEQARMNDDLCLDYFRKRIPLIMIRYALVRAVLRQLKELQRGEPFTIDDSDLEFARLIGDFTLEMQIHMFGNEVMEALQAEAAAFTPRRRADKTRQRFDRLPKQFTREQLMAEGLSYQGAATAIRRWLKDGLVEAEGDHYVKTAKIE